MSLCYSGLYRSTSLSDVDLTTLTGYVVNPRNTQSHVVLHRTKETGDLPRQQANTFNVVFGLHSAETATCRLDIRKKSHRDRLLFRLHSLATTLMYDTFLLRHFHRPHSFLHGHKLPLGFLNPEDGTDRLSRNVGKKSPLLAA
jgi:hypothetical protein